MDPALDPRTPNLHLRYSNEDMLNLNWERLDQAWGQLLAGEIEFPIGDNVFITNNLHVGGDVQIDGDLYVNGTAIFHGPVTFDGPTVTIINDFYVLGDAHLHNLFVDEITINPGGHFNCGGSPVIPGECIVSLDWTQITNKPPGIDTGHAEPIGPAGGDLTDFYPNPHLIPTGVTAGVYGDGANIPRLTVDAKGRLTTVTLVPFVSGGGGSPLGPASGDLTGTYPGPFLITLSPAIPAGTYGGPADIPQVTVDGKGRVTHATHNFIRPGRDPMPPVYVTRNWPDEFDLQLGPNTTKNLFVTPFTPIATGRGRLHGAVSGNFFNSETNPDVGTLHVCWLNLYIYIDGVQKQLVRRSLNLWEPADGHAVGGPIEIPFSIPWTQSVNQTHQVTVQVRNFHTYTEVFDGSYPMSYQVDWTHLLIEEDPEPGIGTNSSYLLAGAVAGATPVAVIGSWIAAYAFTLPGGLVGSQGDLKVAGATTDFDIQVNGVSKGQIHWTAGSTEATFVFPAAVPIVVGDRIEVIGTAGVSDPTWTLRGIL
jgi:hypothetical protein